MNTNNTASFVVASVIFDPTGIAVPVDRDSKRGLQAASRQAECCFVRDIEAHETVEVKYQRGSWIYPEYTPPIVELSDSLAGG
ncbi:MAG: hypothetical protein COA42_06640 [Alteromonadaceae bacterium]|nr:MAG: hypothetical protein COA42_06640 [Alteromonadaceae bacterium]